MTRPRLLHLLGGGQWQVATAALAKELGYRLLISDPNEERPAYVYADIIERVDITDREATLGVAARHRIDGIVCDTTDVGVPTMAYVAEALGLPGIGLEVARNFTDKLRMRQVSSAAGVPNPPFFGVRSNSDFDTAVEALGFPMVVKPTDAQSSRGVHVVRTRDEAAAAFDDARKYTRNGQLIAEGFLDGTEVTVEGFCHDGVVEVSGISDKDHYSHRPEVATRLTYPADFDTAITDRIRSVHDATVRALGLRSGVTHAECMVVGREVYLIEIAARGGGSRIHSHIAPYLAGFPVPEFYLRFVMGERMPVTRAAGERAANLAFFAFPAGVVKAIHGVEAARRLPGVQEILLEFEPGQQIFPPNDDRSRPGLVIIFGRTRAEVLDTTARVMETIIVDVE